MRFQQTVPYQFLNSFLQANWHLDKKTLLVRNFFPDSLPECLNELKVQIFDQSLINGDNKLIFINLD